MNLLCRHHFPTYIVLEHCICLIRSLLHMHKEGNFVQNHILGRWEGEFFYQVQHKWLLDYLDRRFLVAVSG